MVLSERGAQCCSQAARADMAGMRVLPGPASRRPIASLKPRGRFAAAQNLQIGVLHSSDDSGRGAEREGGRGEGGKAGTATQQKHTPSALTGSSSLLTPAPRAERAANQSLSSKDCPRAEISRNSVRLCPQCGSEAGRGAVAGCAPTPLAPTLAGAPCRAPWEPSPGGAPPSGA